MKQCPLCKKIYEQNESNCPSCLTMLNEIQQSERIMERPVGFIAKVAKDKKNEEYGARKNKKRRANTPTPATEIIKPTNQPNGGNKPDRTVLLTTYTLQSEDGKVVYEFKTDSIKIGRECTIYPTFFQDKVHVSRRHAEIFLANNGFPYVRDLQSTNGKYVNDERLIPNKPRKLQIGDCVRLASNVQFYVK